MRSGSRSRWTLLRFETTNARFPQGGCTVTIIERTIGPVLTLPRTVKRGIVLCLDAGLCILTVWIAFYLRLGEFVSLSGPGWPAGVVAPALALPIFVRFGLYRAVFRYVGAEALIAIAHPKFRDERYEFAVHVHYFEPQQEFVV